MLAGNDGTLVLEWQHCATPYPGKPGITELINGNRRIKLRRVR
jgi:hypothetical protein